MSSCAHKQTSVEFATKHVQTSRPEIKKWRQQTHRKPRSPDAHQWVLRAASLEKHPSHVSDYYIITSIINDGRYSGHLRLELRVSRMQLFHFVK